MKICFPVRTNEGLQSSVCDYFGLAPLLLVVDSETREVSELDNRRFLDLRGPERFAVLLGEQRVEALVVIEMGMGAYRNLQAAGIKFFQAVVGTIAENLDALAENNLQEIATEDIDMNGQGKGLGRGQGQGRGLNCRGTGMGRGVAQNQAAGRGQGLGAGRGQGQGLGRGQGMAAAPVADQGMGRGQAQGMGRGQGQGVGRGQGMGRGRGQGLGFEG